MDLTINGDLYSTLNQQVELSLLIIGAIIAINIVNALLGWKLNILGIYPRSLFGWIGIFFAPVLHQGFNHLFFNMIPLFVLINLVLLEGVGVFIDVTAIITVLSGFGIWLFGRKALHVGASALIAGYFSYVILEAYLQQTLMGYFGGFVALYYFGGILFSIFPTEERVSWEGHLFGFLAGIAAAYIMLLMSTAGA